MRFQRRTFIMSFVTAIGFGIVAYAFANPSVAACALIDAAPFVPLADGTLVEANSSDQNHAAVVEHLISEARIRIQNTFGTPRSTPIIVFLNDPNAFWPFKLSEYGGAHFIGTRTCLIIGPKGQNPDVVAHELMHAEIANRVGYWRRLTQLPMWFDEGLAMQVDFRPRYVLHSGAGTETKRIKTLWSASDFFVSDDELLTKNYAVAKAEVAIWVADVGNASVYRQLERIRAGEPFDVVIKDK